MAFANWNIPDKCDKCVYAYYGYGKIGGYGTHTMIFGMRPRPCALCQYNCFYEEDVDTVTTSKRKKKKDKK